MKPLAAIGLVAGLCALSAAGRLEAQRTGTLIVSNMNDNTATLVDVATSKAIATVPTGEGPHEVAATHDGKWALVSNYGVRGKAGNSITVIDVAKASVVRTIDLGEYQRPHGMKFLPGDSLVVVTSETSRAILLLDFKNAKVVKAMPTGGRGGHMIGLAANGDRLVTGNISDGTISVMAIPSGEVKQFPVARQPEGVAMSPDGTTAWAGSNRDSVVLVVNTSTGATDTLRNFGLPYRIAISGDGRRAVVTDPMKAQVRVFDAKTHRELRSIDIPRDSLVATTEVPSSPAPEGVTVSADGKWAFVTLQGRNRVVTIDVDRGAIVGWAPTGVWSDGIAYSPLTHGR